MKKFGLGIMLAIAFFIGTTLLSGCGGGGGGGATVTNTPGHGRVKAAMTFPSRNAGRAAGQESGDIIVDITISGYYGEDNSVFPPVTLQVAVSYSSGYARVENITVPIGVNHLISAVATYPDGATATIKAILPEIEEGVATTAEVNTKTTVVANAAILYASQNEITLAELPQGVLDEIENVVDILIAAGNSPENIDAEDVLAFETLAVIPASIEISPETATVSLDATQQFTTMIYNEFGIEIATTVVTWSVSTEIGAIDDAGLFTPSAEGTGTVSAVAGEATATAVVEVVLIACNAYADCDDGDPLTTDTCVNPGTSQSACENTCDIACSADADCGTTDSTTIYTCSSPGECSAACSSCSVFCNDDTGCDDSQALTADTCLSAGTCDSYCDSVLDTTLVPQFSSFMEHPDTNSILVDIILDDTSEKLFANNYIDNGFLSLQIEIFDILTASHTTSIILDFPAITMLKDPARDVAYLVGLDIEIPPPARMAPGAARQAMRQPGKGRMADRSANVEVEDYYWKVGKLDLSSETVEETITSSMAVYGSGMYAVVFSNQFISESQDKLYFSDVMPDGPGYTIINRLDLGSFTVAQMLVTEGFGYYGGVMELDDEADTLYMSIVDTENYTDSIMAVDMIVDEATTSPFIFVEGAPTGITTATDTFFINGILEKIDGMPYLYTVTMDGEFGTGVMEAFDPVSGTSICTAAESVYAIPRGSPVGIFKPFNHIYISGDTGTFVLDATDCSTVAALDLPIPEIMGMAVDEAAGRVYLSHGYYFISVIQYAPDGTITPPDTSGLSTDGGVF